MTYYLIPNSGKTFYCGFLQPQSLMIPFYFCKLTEDILFFFFYSRKDSAPCKAHFSSLHDTHFLPDFSTLLLYPDACLYLNDNLLILWRIIDAWTSIMVFRKFNYTDKIWLYIYTRINQYQVIWRLSNILEYKQLHLKKVWPWIDRLKQHVCVFDMK